MFTGIVEAVGTIVEVKSGSGGYRIRLRAPLADQLTVGDSLAVNGVCLTIVLVDTGEVQADIGPETARLTTLGTLQPGAGVNLERAMRADTRLGGHLVQGHIDGTGTITDVRPEGDSHWLTIGFPASLAPFLIRKGAIAVDGVSLTIAGLGTSEFDVQIVPFTWDATTLRRMRSGDRVNLECDMIGKYVARVMELTATRAD